MHNASEVVEALPGIVSGKVHPESYVNTVQEPNNEDDHFVFYCTELLLRKKNSIFA